PSRPRRSSPSRGPALALLHVLEDLVAEERVEADDGGDGGRAQRADRGLGEGGVETRADVVAHVEEEVEVGVAPLAVLDAVEDLLDPARPLPAGRALA